MVEPSIFKICARQTGSSPPKKGVKSKDAWHRHLVLVGGRFCLFGSGKEMILQDLIGWVGRCWNGDEISRIHSSPTQTPCFMVVPWCSHTFEGEPTTYDNMKGFLSTGRTKRGRPCRVSPQESLPNLRFCTPDGWAMLRWVATKPCWHTAGYCRNTGDARNLVTGSPCGGFRLSPTRGYNCLEDLNPITQLTRLSNERPRGAAPVGIFLTHIFSRSHHGIS